METSVKPMFSFPTLAKNQDPGGNRANMLDFVS
jgi:hypothetical protein